MSFNVKTRLSMLKGSAKARGLKIDLDINKYQALINLGCHFCGLNLATQKGYCLDRVNSNRGYVLTNVVACCKQCNIAKSNMEIWEFVDWLKRAHAHTTAAIAMVEAEDTGYKIEDELVEHNKLIVDKEKHRLEFNPTKENL